MLSDEEKKALKELTEIKELVEEDLKYEDYEVTATLDQIDLESLVTILNLIEKQSKEIEHQIEKRANQRQELAILNAKQIEFNKLVNTVNSYKGQFKRQQKEIEELKADKYGLEEEVQIQAKQLIEIDGNYISKEESEQKERKAYIKGTNDADELCNKKWEDKIKAKIGIRKDEKEICKDSIEEKYLLREIYVLQSLLEKE